MHYDNMLAEVTDAAIAELSQSVTLDDGSTVHGFFDPQWTDPMLNHVDGNLLEPSLRLKINDATGLVTGRMLTVDNTLYRIVRVIPGESPGLVRLVLQ